MKIERTFDFFNGDKSWTITISRHEFNALNLSAFDQRLLDECASQDATIADVLLGLETHRKTHRGKPPSPSRFAKDMTRFLTQPTSHPLAVGASLSEWRGIG